VTLNGNPELSSFKKNLLIESRDEGEQEETPSEGKETENTVDENSFSDTFQNNILLSETVSKGANIEDELTKQNLYKTEQCKNWLENGTCRYGDKCQFAHGSEELRPVLRHPKYKTAICITFHNYGTCPYGKRCRFVHHSPNENSPPKEEQKKVSKKSRSLKQKKECENDQESQKKSGSKLPFFQKLHKQKKTK